MPLKEKIYKNGAILVYRKLKRKHTSVAAGFVFGKNRDKYPEPVAHFCEHMFFKETKDLNEQQLNEKILDVFSMYNAHTSPYCTWFDFCRANKVIEPCFELASEMLLNTKFSKKCMESEKGVIKQELNMHLNNPNEIFGGTRLRALTTENIPNTRTSGSTEEIDAITAKDLQKFKDEVFISQNFLITIEGGLSYIKAKKLAEKYFINKLKSNPNYSVDKTNIEKYDRPGNMNVENFQFNKSLCSIIIRLDKNMENIKTDATNRMLSKICNGVSGKLCKRLRDKGLVYSARIRTNEIINHYYIRVRWECVSDNVNKCIDEIGKVFKDLRNIKIDNALLDKKKENVKLAKDESCQGPIYPSNLFLNYLNFEKEDYSKKRIKQYEKTFESLTPDDIQNFCNTVLSKPENIYVSILTGEKEPNFYSYEKIQEILTK